MWFLGLVLAFAAAATATYSVAALARDVVARSRAENSAAPKDAIDELGFFADRDRIVEWCYSLALLGGGAACILFMGLFPRFWWAGLSAGALAGSGCFFAPRRAIFWLARRRRAKFEKQLPDALVLIRNGLRSGRSILQCLESVTREMADPMRKEMAVFLRHHRMGKDISECAELMRRRMPSEDLSLVLISIQASQKAGGNLSHVLERIERTIRVRLALRDRLATLTAQGRFEGLVMGAAPFGIAGVLILVDGRLMAPMFDSPAGWIAWAAVGSLETLAFLMIRKIVSVEL